MTSNQYSQAQNSNYASLKEENYNDLCTTNACREFPYVRCGTACDTQCERMKWGTTAKYDFTFANGGCASGMSGDCGCKTKRSLFFDERGYKTPMYQ